MALAKKANTAASRSLQKVSDWLQSVEPPTSVALECELNSEQLGGDVCVDGNHGDEFAQPVECTANAEQPGGNSCVDGNRADKSAAVEHQAQRQMLNPSTSTFEYESDSGGEQPSSDRNRVDKSAAVEHRAKRQMLNPSTGIFEYESDSGGEQPFSDRNRVDKSAAVEHRAKRQMLNPSTGIFEYESDSGQSFSSRVSGTTNNTYDSECIPDLSRHYKKPLSCHNKKLTVSQSTSCQKLSVVLVNGSEITRRCHNYCYYCDGVVKQLPRHLKRRHNDITEVCAVLCKIGRERKLGLLKMRNLGNFKHNISVIESGSGTLRVWKRCSKQSQNPDDYLPCTHCLAFYAKDQLWRHMGHCPLKMQNAFEDKNENTGRTSCCAAGRLLIEGSLLKTSSCSIDPEFKTAVLDNMRKDRIRGTAAGDALIANFGQVLFKRLGPHRAVDIQQRMRQLARLLQAVNSGDGVTSPFTLFDLIDGSHFDAVLDAVQQIAGVGVHSSGRRMYKIPSTASKLGHSLKRCAQLKLGMAIRQGDSVMERDANAFLLLHASEWQDSVSSVCIASTKLAKMNKTQALPSRQDLDKVRNFQTDRIQHLTKVVKQKPLYRPWRQLSEVTMTRMTLFNKRRGGEAAALRVSEYNQRPDWQASCHPEIVSSLMSVEKELIKRMDMVQIAGKRINNVPILLTPDVKTAMDVLLETRAAVGIPSANPYFFPSYSEQGHLDPYQVLQRVVRQAGVSNPDSITTTRARKYVATMMQLQDLTHVEMDWVSKHLGHSLNIHKAYYRQHTAAIEMGKVTRLLLQLDSGHSSDYNGKTLDKVAEEEIPVSLESDADDDVEPAGDEQCENAEGNEVHSSDEIDNAISGDALRSAQPSNIDVYDTDDECSGATRKRRTRVIRDSDDDSAGAEQATVLQKARRLSRSCRRTTTDASTTIQDDDDISSALPGTRKQAAVPQKARRLSRSSRRTTTAATTTIQDDDDISSALRGTRAQSLRIPWSAHELDLLQTTFATFLASATLPGFYVITEAQRRYPIFAKRTPAQIKSRFQQLIKMRNK